MLAEENKKILHLHSKELIFILCSHRINQKLEPLFWLMTLNSLVNPLVYLGKTKSVALLSIIHCPPR